MPKACDRDSTDPLLPIPTTTSKKFAHIPRIEAAAAAASVVVSLALLVIKFVAYFFTGSAAIFSDALESIVNVAASIVAAYSLYLAHQPPDESHPYGHGKVEFISAAFEGGMILVAAMVIAWQAIESFIRGPELQKLDFGLALIGVAGAINGVVGLALIKIGRSRSSATLSADGRHLLTDAVTSASVLVALILIRLTGFAWIDPVAALVVAAYIVVVGFRLLGESTAGLMDRQDVEDMHLLTTILDAHVGSIDEPARPPRICGYHKLRHRHSGRYHWVDFHIEVPAGWDVERGHQVATLIENEIQQSLGEGNATAHVEPCTGATCRTCRADATGG